MTNYNTTVTTSNGTYSVGMKRADAEKKDIYSCFAGIDFKDLDKDNNGVLSQQEILEGRVAQAKRDGVSDSCMGTMLWAGGAMLAGTCAVAEPATFGVSTVGVVGGFSVMAMGGYKVQNADIRLKEAENELAAYKKDAQAQKKDEQYKQKPGIGV